MTTQIGSVAVEVRAELAPLRDGLRKAETETKAFGVAADRAFRGGFGNAATAAGRSVQAVQADMQNLRFQLNDVATGLLSGGSPFMVLSQQAGQFSQILGSAGGVRGAVGMLGGAFMSMLNPINLGIAAIGVAAYAATSFFDDAEDGADAASDALRRHADVIDRVRDRYGEASIAAIKYAQDSQEALGFDAALNAETQLTSLTAASKEFLETVGGIGRGGYRVDDEFYQFAGAIRTFRDSVIEGRPDVDTLLAQIRETAAGSPSAAAGIIGIAEALREAAGRAREATAALSTVTAAPMYARGGPSMGPDFRGPTLVGPGVRPPGSYIDLVNDPAPGGGRRGGGGGGGRDVFGGLGDRARERIRALEQERVAIGLSGEALARYRAELSVLNPAHSEWNKLTEDQREQLQALATEAGNVAAANEQIRATVSETQRAQDEMASALDALGQSAENLFMGLIEGGDAAKQAIAQLAAELLKAALLGSGPLGALFGGGLLGGASVGRGGLGPGGGPLPIGPNRAPSGRLPGAARVGGPVSVGGATIIVQGNADSNALATMDARLKRFQREQARMLDERDRNMWRTN